MIEIDPVTKQVVDDFDAHAKKRAAELLASRSNDPLQATRVLAFCLGYKAGVVDLSPALRERPVVDVARMAAVFEAAARWRDAPCDQLSFCDRGEHEHECTVEKRERDLVAAVDAARKEPQ